jgi:hypothetical protein
MGNSEKVIDHGWRGGPTRPARTEQRAFGGHPSFPSEPLGSEAADPERAQGVSDWRLPRLAFSHFHLIKAGIIP